MQGNYLVNKQEQLSETHQFLVAELKNDPYRFQYSSIDIINEATCKGSNIAVNYITLLVK